MSVTRKEVFELNAELSKFLQEPLLLKVKRDLTNIHEWAQTMVKKFTDARNEIIKSIAPEGSIPEKTPEMEAFVTKWNDYLEQGEDTPVCWKTFPFADVAELKTTGHYPTLYRLIFV
jgi:hypothetical protein